ncbi:MAG: EpsG family protein, partial [Halanaerobiales bacterium]
AGLRFGVGADYWGYYSYFTNRMPNFNFNEGIEPGFEILIYITGIMGNYSFFLFVVSILTFLFIGLGIKYLNNGYILIPLYIYTVMYFIGGPFGQIRQALAIAILLYSVTHIVSKNLTRFIFWVFIATTIHVSSLIFIVAYCLNYIKVNKKFLQGKATFPCDFV